jgi:hypothetical protein
MPKLFAGLNDRRPLGDGNSLWDMALAMLLRMPAPETFAMRPSQKRDEVSGFGVDELVNGFVGDATPWVLQGKATGDLLRRPPNRELLQDITAYLGSLETLVGPGTAISFGGAEMRAGR